MEEEKRRNYKKEVVRTKKAILNENWTKSNQYWRKYIVLFLCKTPSTGSEDLQTEVLKPIDVMSKQFLWNPHFAQERCKTALPTIEDKI
jgi:hypothetical protein